MKNEREERTTSPNRITNNDRRNVWRRMRQGWPDDAVRSKTSIPTPDGEIVIISKINPELRKPKKKGNM